MIMGHIFCMVFWMEVNESLSNSSWCELMGHMFQKRLRVIWMLCNIAYLLLALNSTAARILEVSRSHAEAVGASKIIHTKTHTNRSQVKQVKEKTQVIQMQNKTEDSILEHAPIWYQNEFPIRD